MSYDYMIFQGSKQPGDNLQPLQLGLSGSACSGIQKTAQSFLKMFLTDKGTVAGDPDAGTYFMSALRTSQVKDETSLNSIFQIAVTDVLNYQGIYQTRTIDPDEVIEFVELIQWDMRPGFLSIQFKITTQAGTSAEYTVPINTGVTS